MFNLQSGNTAAAVFRLVTSFPSIRLMWFSPVIKSSLPSVEIKTLKTIVLKIHAHFFLYLCSRPQSILCVPSSTEPTPPLEKAFLLIPLS